MRLTLETKVLDDVVVIRCKGRISFGLEVDALQAEIDKNTKFEGTNIFSAKQVVLNLRETDYIDSSGLGALVRMFGVLRAAGGGLKLCELSPTVQKTIEITNLGVLFPSYASESQAIESFGIAHPHGPQFDDSKSKIVCVDPSRDLLAGLSALLSTAGYEVFTTPFVGEAATLVKATRPRLVICGPGMMSVPTAPAVIEKFRSGTSAQILHLPPDFHITEAGQAGKDLLAQVASLLT